MSGLDRFSLSGRTVLLTGSGGALGSLLAQEFAAAGARVGLQDISEERVAAPQRAIIENGGEAITFAADLADPAACRTFIGAAAAALDGIDVLVNCAGVNRRKLIDDVTPDDFDAIVAVNMRAVYFLSQAIHPVFKARGGGVIVNLSSFSARYSYQTISVYAATKAAVSSMTRSFAQEWAGDGIRVNCVEPSVVQTEFTRPLWDDPKRGEWFEKHSPMGRLALPDEIVGAVLFLASDASSYITGQSIVIDGGILTGADWDGPVPGRAD
jgi:NAD(P)-dependent dehydrogenase (short-subunit alcohol dehydrogenase family)